MKPEGVFVNVGRGSLIRSSMSISVSQGEVAGVSIGEAGIVEKPVYEGKGES